MEPRISTEPPESPSLPPHSQNPSYQPHHQNQHFLHHHHHHFHQHFQYHNDYHQRLHIGSFPQQDAEIRFASGPVKSAVRPHAVANRLLLAFAALLLSASVPVPDSNPISVVLVVFAAVLVLGGPTTFGFANDGNEVFPSAAALRAQMKGHPAAAAMREKMESLHAHVVHLRSVVDAERNAHALIAGVHAKTQVVVEEQRDEITRLEGVVESLQCEVDRLTARLVEALFEKGVSAATSLVALRQKGPCGFDAEDRVLCTTDEDEGATNAKTASPPMSGVRVFERSGHDSSDDECNDDDDDSEEEDDEEAEEFDDDDYLLEDTPCVIVPAFGEVLKQEIGDGSDETKFDWKADKIGKESAEIDLEALATHHLLQCMLGNASPSYIPTQLDSLKVRMSLSLEACSRIVVNSLLRYMDASLSKLSAATTNQELPKSLVKNAGSSPQDLAQGLRELFRKHLVLLQIFVLGLESGSVSGTRSAGMDALDLYCFALPRRDGVWADTFGLIVYVLVDLDVLEAKDVVLWWHARGRLDITEKDEEVSEDRFRTCRPFMQRLVDTLEPFCHDEDDSVGVPQDGDSKNLDGNEDFDALDVDCDGSCCASSDGGDATLVAGEEVVSVGSDLLAGMVVAGVDEKQQFSERRVSFKE